MSEPGPRWELEYCLPTLHINSQVKYHECCRIDISRGHPTRICLLRKGVCFFEIFHTTKPGHTLGTIGKPSMSRVGWTDMVRPTVQELLNIEQSFVIEV
jgi:hypothetical protein